MTDNEKALIGVIETLCDAVGDSPCGCDACPYVSSEEQCEVYDLIGKVKEGGSK